MTARRRPPVFSSREFRTRRRASVTSRKARCSLTWPTSDLVLRLYLLISIRHRHRREKAVWQDTKEPLNSPCIFKVPRSTHSNHFFRGSWQVCPQTSHSTFLFTRFQTSSEPHRCPFIVSKSQNISIPDWHTIDMSQALLRLR